MPHNVRLVREAARQGDAQIGLDVLVLERQGTNKYAHTSDDSASKVGQGLQGPDRDDIMGLWTKKNKTMPP